MENTAPADPAAAFDRDPTDGIVATSRPPITFRYYDLVMAAFVAILALIPAALWLLKRTPLGGNQGGSARPQPGQEGQAMVGRHVGNP